jgi:hypothetical protein
MVTLFSIGLYIALEMLVKIFIQFKLRNGVYFWSMIAASVGILINVLGFLLKFWAPSVHWSLSLTLITIGVCGMVTGYALVLYSRLHLVLYNAKLRRYVLYMIIFDAVVFHSLSMGSMWGMQTPAAPRVKSLFLAAGRMQAVVFSVQETIISAIYIWAVLRLLTPTRSAKTRLMRRLIYVNAIIIALDLAALGTVIADSFLIDVSSKPVIYAVKLKLEFTVLNQLMKASSAAVNAASGQSRSTPKSGSHSGHSHPSACRPADTRIHAGGTSGGPSAGGGGGGGGGGGAAATAVSTRQQSGARDANADKGIPMQHISVRSAPKDGETVETDPPPASPDVSTISILAGKGEPSLDAAGQRQSSPQPPPATYSLSLSRSRTSTATTHAEKHFNQPTAREYDWIDDHP